MQEVVDSIIAAEQEARNRISEAAKQADAVRAKSDADSSAMISQAKERAAAELKRRVDAARRHAEEEYLEARKKAERKADALYASMEPLVAELAKKAARLAMKTELER
jgi:vacuolar-type H+-ATPase subunit H